MSDFQEPTLSADEVLARVKIPRLRYTLVGLAGLTAALLIGTLWATEPGPLPPRTHLAFGAMVLIGLGWTGFAGWVLNRKAPLFGKDRVIAGWMALAFATAASAGMVAIAVTRGDAVLSAIITGVTLVATAGAMLANNRRRHQELVRLKEKLSASTDG